MNVDEVKHMLTSDGHQIVKEEKLANNTGSQLRLQGGQIVNVFNTGRINVQGKNAKAITDLIGEISPTGGSSNPSKKSLSNQVFVVYGHDSEARNQLEAMLRRWGLEPLIIDQLPSEGQTIIEKLENHTGRVGFGVVLATPDDEGHKAGR